MILVFDGAKFPNLLILEEAGTETVPPVIINLISYTSMCRLKGYGF